MGKYRGRRPRGIVDMSKSPTADTEPTALYYPPRIEECDESGEFPLVISAHERIAGRALIYQGRVVEFAMTIQVRDDRDWVDIARIDCAHGTVHIHQMHHSGREDTVSEICQIPAGGRDEEAWHVINKQYDDCTDRLVNEFDEFVRVWRAT